MTESAPSITPRCTAVEADQRVTQVIEWLVAGHGRRGVMQLAADAWGLATRQIDVYLARAYDALREDNEREREALTGLGVAQRDHLYKLALAAIEAADADARGPLISAARAVLTDRDRLRALYATDRASLARAGLDKALAEAGLTASAAELREILRAGAASRAERGLDDDTRDDDAEYIDLPGADDGA